MCLRVLVIHFPLTDNYLKLCAYVYVYLHMLVHLSLFYFTQRSLLDDDLEDMESESEEEEERQVQ